MYSMRKLARRKCTIQPESPTKLSLAKLSNYLLSVSIINPAEHLSRRSLKPGQVPKKFFIKYFGIFNAIWVKLYIDLTIQTLI